MKKEIKIACQGAGTMSITQMVPFQGDLKTITKEDLEKIKNEIITDGFSFPIHLWEDPISGNLYIIDGHQRHKALQSLKKDGYSVPAIPIVMVEASSIEQAKHKLLAAASVYGDIQAQGVVDFLKDSNITIDDMAKTLKLNTDMDYILQEYTFNDQDLINVSQHTRDLNNHADDEDEIPEVVEPIAKLGQIYQLGEHRLMCGDSKDQITIDSLLISEKDFLLLTDPPYGMSAVKPDGNIGGNRVGKNGYGEKGQYGKEAKCGVYKPIIGDDEFFDPSYLTKLGTDQIIFGANHFSTHLPLSPHWIVWYKDMPVGTDFSGAELAWTSIDKKAVKTYKWAWAGMIRQGSREDGLTKRVHPTQKPVGLYEMILKDYKYNNIVDLFGGSGSCLIACEKINRKCFMMELDPHYVDVIIARWEKFTGQKAELITNEKTILRKK